MKAARPPKRERTRTGERTREPKSVRRPNDGGSAAEARACLGGRAYPRAEKCEAS